MKGLGEAWPVGWHTGRRILRQEDVFELLGVPYREPADPKLSIIAIAL